MNEYNMRFAFAVNSTNNFDVKHFGDADKYLIYEFTNGDFKLILAQINELQTLNDDTNHGSAKKGNSIIELLKSHQVNVLVSKQFGPNIKMVNQHFIPVVIYKDNLPDVQSILKKNMKWFVDEFDNGTAGHKLFSINKGILKSSIK